MYTTLDSDLWLMQFSLAWIEWVFYNIINGDIRLKLRHQKTKTVICNINLWVSILMKFLIVQYNIIFYDIL